MELTLDITPDLERELRQEADREGLDEGSFVLRLVRERLSRRSRGSRSEADLLEEINRGLSAERWQRYRELIGKRRAGTLTHEEHAELTATGLGSSI